MTQLQMQQKLQHIEQKVQRGFEEVLQKGFKEIDQKLNALECRIYGLETSMQNRVLSMDQQPQDVNQEAIQRLQSDQQQTYLKMQDMEQTINNLKVQGIL